MKLFFLFLILFSFGCPGGSPTSDLDIGNSDAVSDMAKPDQGTVDVEGFKDVNGVDTYAQDTSEDSSSLADTSDTSYIDMNEGDMNEGDMNDASTKPRGECVSDVDCSDGGSCVSVNGWKTCVKRYPERTECNQPGRDACCNSGQCADGTNGVCLSPVRACSGIQPPTANVCYYDSCATNADCTEENFGICVPGGAFGVPTSTCSYGTCRVDSDCSTGANGKCVPFKEPCVGRHQGFFCVYDDSECKTDSDCKGNGGTGRPYCAASRNAPLKCDYFHPPA